MGGGSFLGGGELMAYRTFQGQSAGNGMQQPTTEETVPHLGLKTAKV